MLWVPLGVAHVNGRSPLSPQWVVRTPATKRSRLVAADQEGRQSKFFLGLSLLAAPTGSSLALVDMFSHATAPPSARRQAGLELGQSLLVSLFHRRCGGGENLTRNI